MKTLHRECLGNVVKAMTWDRRLIEIDAAWMQDNATHFFYVQASDGVWVPKCDLLQYEAGGRPWA